MKKTPFYHKAVEAGATMGTGAYSTARKYSNSTPAEEHHAVRNTVGITDFSTMSKFDIKGEDALEFVQKMIVNDATKLQHGRVRYSCMANADGGVFDDTTVYCFDDNHYWIVGSTAARAKVDAHLKEHSKDMRAYVTDVTSTYGLLSVQGPKSRDLLNSISTPSLEDLGYFWFQNIEIDGIPVIASRSGFTGELGFELYILAEDCPDVWDIVSEAGKSFDAKYCGMIAAGGTVRMEKGLIGGSDYGEDTNPYEVGLGWTVHLNTDFLGRDALQKVKEEGPKRKLMGFRIDTEDVAKSGNEVLINDEVVGKVTSAAWSVTYDISFGMALMDTNHAEEGMKVQIKMEDKLVDATLANKTLHDPENKRVRS